MVLAEQILPMQELGGHVHLVSPDSLDLYRELSDHPGDFIPGQPGPRAKTPNRTAECVNPIHEQQEPKHCECGETIYPLIKLVRVHDDVCERCRIKLGLPAPLLPP
jgi:hypothetical protein